MIYIDIMFLKKYKLNYFIFSDISIKMLKLFYISIILFIIYHYITDDYRVIEEKPVEIKKVFTPSNSLLSSYNFINPSANTNVNPMLDIADVVRHQNKKDIINHFTNTNDDVDDTIDFNSPNPWTKIIKNKDDEYPYHFYLKINIPSLNDYTTWLQVIPNLGFDPRTGELIIPSKDEVSALAIANLIAINFAGQMSITDILNKNLIPISINKARKHKVVQKKLREQIKEHIYGKTIMKGNTDFEKDLAIKTSNVYEDEVNTNNLTTMIGAPKSQAEFKDTFRHFTDQPIENNYNIDPYDGTDFSHF